MKETTFQKNNLNNAYCLWARCGEVTYASRPPLLGVHIPLNVDTAMTVYIPRPIFWNVPLTASHVPTHKWLPSFQDLLGVYITYNTYSNVAAPIAKWSQIRIEQLSGVTGPMVWKADHFAPRGRFFHETTSAILLVTMLIMASACHRSLRWICWCVLTFSFANKCTFNTRAYWPCV